VRAGNVRAAAPARAAARAWCPARDARVHVLHLPLLIRREHRLWPSLIFRCSRHGPARCSARERRVSRVQVRAAEREIRLVPRDLTVRRPVPPETSILARARGLAPSARAPLRAASVRLPPPAPTRSLLAALRSWAGASTPAPRRRPACCCIASPPLPRLLVLGDNTARHSAGVARRRIARNADGVKASTTQSRLDPVADRRV